MLRILITASAFFLAGAQPTVGSECSPTRTCPLTQSCERGRCVALAPPPPRPTLPPTCTRENCRSPSTCDDRGVCRSPPPPPPPPRCDDSPRGNCVGGRCVDNRCVIPTPPASCNRENCRFPATCDNRGVCRAPPPPPSPPRCDDTPGGNCIGGSCVDGTRCVFLPPPDLFCSSLTCPAPGSCGPQGACINSPFQCLAVASVPCTPACTWPNGCNRLNQCVLLNFIAE